MPRLAIKKTVLRDLAIKSKNQCAFPGCDHPLMDENNVFLGEICHVEAAEEGGERYNSNQNDEQRRSFENLIMFCHAHHKVTDNVEEFPVERLKKIKSDHEALPSTTFNSEKLVKIIEKFQESQIKTYHKVQEFIDSQTNNKNKKLGYKIISPTQQEAWLPEQGKFYKNEFPDGSYFNYMMKGDYCCIEHRLSDGAIAYYEINEQGDVRESKFPYPIEEYRVVIPEDMVLRTVVETLPQGRKKTTKILKWTGQISTIEDINGKIIAIESKTRIQVSHQDRLIKVLKTECAYNGIHADPHPCPEFWS